MVFVEVLKLKDLNPGAIKLVNIKGQEIAVYNVDNKIYATQNKCLHEKGPLNEGSLDNNIVMCPWHGWRYDVEDGSCKTTPGLKLKTYKTKIDKEKIFIEV
jgi:nitrite reductase/ring-hydroxylating ferredoxin subunit